LGETRNPFEAQATDEPESVARRDSVVITRSVYAKRWTGGRASLRLNHWTNFPKPIGDS
jgi:hypothetical protein